MPFFAVVIPTRDRPALFRQALASVLAQSWSDNEIIVVNDGSAAEHRQEYASALSCVASHPRVHSFDLAPSPRGHGQSFALNFGATKATAPYLCFLDDDDWWTDANHLERAHAVLSGSGTTIDLYMCDQAAFLNGEQQPRRLWISDLPAILAKSGTRPDSHGAHTVAVAQLLQSQGFCHLNTLIVRRALFQEVDGMAETIRWECDHDLYLRLIDRATTIKYVPVTVSRHNIPDPAKRASMTTALSETERRIFQLEVFRRAQSLCRNPAIQAHARRHAAYTLKRIAQSLAAERHHAEAAAYARKALRAGPTFKWALYTAWLRLREWGGLWSSAVSSVPTEDGR